MVADRACNTGVWSLVILGRNRGIVLECTTESVGALAAWVLAPLLYFVNWLTNNPAFGGARALSGSLD